MIVTQNSFSYPAISDKKLFFKKVNHSCTTLMEKIDRLYGKYSVKQIKSVMYKK